MLIVGIQLEATRWEWVRLRIKKLASEIKIFCLAWHLNSKGASSPRRGNWFSPLILQYKIIIYPMIQRIVRGQAIHSSYICGWHPLNSTEYLTIFSLSSLPSLYLEEWEKYLKPMTEDFQAKMARVKGAIGNIEGGSAINLTFSSLRYALNTRRALVHPYRDQMQPNINIQRFRLNICLFTKRTYWSPPNYCFFISFLFCQIYQNQMVFGMHNHWE